MPARRGFHSPCLLFLLAVLALPTSVGLSENLPPRVLGFERVYASSDKDRPAAAGQLLLGELNCTSCHHTEPALAEFIHRKPAPILDTVGQRFVRALIDECHPRGRHYLTSTGAPRFRRLRTFVASGSDTLSSRKYASQAASIISRLSTGSTPR